MEYVVKWSEFYKAWAIYKGGVIVHGYDHIVKSVVDIDCKKLNTIKL